MVAIHVYLFRRFCIIAVSEQSSVHEYEVKLLSVCVRMVRGFGAILFFEERVDQYQLVLDFPVSEPLASAVYLSERVCFAL